MERARRVVLVPDDGSNQPSHSSDKSIVKSVPPSKPSEDNETVQTPGDNLSRLDSELYELLHSNKYTDLYEKCQNYLQVLRRFLYQVRNESSPSNVASTILENTENVVENPEDKPLFESEILHSIPNNLLKKAALLLRHRRQNDRLAWSNTGVIKIADKLLNESNIAELLAHVVKKKSKYVEDPLPGRGEFINFIRESETPLRLLRSPEILDESNASDFPTAPPLQPHSLSLMADFSTPMRTRSQIRQNWKRLNIGPIQR